MKPLHNGIKRHDKISGATPSKHTDAMPSPLSSRTSTWLSTVTGTADCGEAVDPWLFTWTRPRDAPKRLDHVVIPLLRDLRVDIEAVVVGDGADRCLAG